MEWQRRAQGIREQVLVSCGLWPLPEKTPLNAKVFGRVDRDGYSLETRAREMLVGLGIPDEAVERPLGTLSGGYKLRVGFSDGSAGAHDFSSTAARDGEMVRPLKDPAFFAKVFIELGALTWPNGFDLDSIALHDRMAKAGELAQVAAE